MCGICGIINPRGVTDKEISSMISILAHRGPDGQGVFFDSYAGLGHRRLSIIDVTGGKQPMSNEDGSIWIVFNGEIYNYQEIRNKLCKNHQFKTMCDTEVILHLYEEKKEKCLQDLRGMFAFAIYDSNEKKIFMARDHLGQKPLYYHHDGDSLLFASEIKSLLAIKPSLRSLNCKALYEYLTLRIITSPRSMFLEINKLPPGHFLIFHKGKIDVKQYWQLRFEPKLKNDFGEVLNQLEKQIEDSVRYHMVSDVPVGAFLSGGMDSSLIVAMMSKFTDKSIKTFAGDIPYQNFSEGKHAKMVSQQYKTEHHELTIIPDLLKKLPHLVWHLDEPSDPLSVCMYDIAQFARRHVKVVLGGDGGDELFGGYDRYYGNNLIKYYCLLPESVRRHVLGHVLKLMPEGFWYKSVSHKLKWMHQMSFSHGGERYAKSLSYFYFSDAYKKFLYTDKFCDTVGVFDPEENLKTYFQSGNAKDVIDKMLYTDVMTRMPDHPVMIQDRMTMAHGLEARSPFLDHKLVEFCASIPASYKVRGTRLRYIQVELAKKYLPPTIVAKKKQGFSSALPYVLNNDFDQLYKVLLFDSNLVADGYLRQGAIDFLLDEHFKRKADHGNRLWLLCNSEIWYRMLIKDCGIESMQELLLTVQR